jgi:spermidine synthase
LPGKAWAATQVLLALLAAALAWSVPEAPAGLIAFGRKLATSQPEPEYLYVGEGANASIAVSEYDPLTRYFHVSGKTVASSEPYDMRLQLMLGHLPALLHPNPRSVLVVGCGAGVTAGTFLAHPDVERVVICEIEPLIPQAARQHFGLENSYVLDDPRVEVVIDDARHYLLKTDERFDIITSDPIHPWVKGAAALYSQEYFELCRQRLNPGGLTTQWVPLYETSLAAVKSEIATFFRVFPEGTIWNNEVDNAGYDIVLLGGSGSAEIDLDQLQERLQQEEYQLVQQSLEQVELGDALSLLLTYAGRAADLKPWLADAQLNRDSNLRLQYLAGLGLNLNRSAAILDSMLEYRRYPEGLFVASSATQRELRKLLEVSAAE